MCNKIYVIKNNVKYIKVCVCIYICVYIYYICVYICVMCLQVYTHKYIFTQHTHTYSYAKFMYVYLLVNNSTA